VEGTEDLGMDDSNSPVKGFFGAAMPLVFAHRGGGALGPENTLAAFDLGVSAGADGLELDVRLSRDGVVVVHHDATLDRTTNATGPLTGLTADELARVDAGFRCQTDAGYPFRGRNVGIPTLRQVLQRYPGLRIIIEMKVDSEELGRAVADEVRRAGAGDRVCLAGSDSRVMAAARHALPEAASSATRREVRLALYRSLARWPVRHVGYGGYQVPERAAGHTIVTPRFIRDAHAAGLRVQVWTVDEEPDMRRLLAWGVDALISDRPDAAVRIRNKALGVPQNEQAGAVAGDGNIATGSG
jgi:glycerophosphoryl diester phosphodiesterase